MIITPSIPNAAHTPSEQRIAQLLGRADAYPLGHYFSRAAASGEPIKVPLPAQALTMRRDLSASVASGGGYLVGTKTTGPASFIEGYDAFADALVMTGLSSPTVIPRVATQPSGYWIAEGASITESQPVFGSVTLAPHWLCLYLQLSRQLSLQSPEAEPIIIATIAESFRLSLMTALLGVGGGAQPRGLAGTTGVNAINGAGFDAGDARDMFEPILAAGGRLDRIRCFGPPAVWKLLAAREFSTGSGRPIADKGTIEGQPFAPVAQAPASTLIAADMGRVVVGIFDGLAASLEVDPYSDFRSGVVAYRLLVGVDIGVLTPAAVSVATSVS
ncbi:MAG: phage major capsid protein [Burkholderiales bacterium]|nr:phage major capsid protein [Burkholderiales bacterium]